MAESRKSSSYRDRVIKNMATYLVKSLTDAKVESSLPSAREFLSALAGIAGKGKDELVQTICKEIGQATAAVLKEPIAEILRDRRLQITIELVPTYYEKKSDTSETRSKGESESSSDSARGSKKRPILRRPRN